MPVLGGIGWAKWNEPGGFLWDIYGRFRKSAWYWIFFNIMLLVGQIGFWAWGRMVSRASVENFIYQSIFFTFTSNLVTWFFAIATWKYARDSQEALNRYNDELEMKTKELGWTITDLNDIGKAIQDAHITSESVTEGIAVMRDLFLAIEKSNLTPEQITDFLKQLPMLTRATIAEKRLTDDWNSMEGEANGPMQ